MEHTIQHLQQATRLIYFVSGAIVAMLYFVIEKMRDVPAQRYLGVALIVLLGAVNVLHALLIMVQHRWYKAIDKQLAWSVGVEPVTRGKTRLGSGWLWVDLHVLIAAAAFGAALYILWSGAKF